MKRIITFLLPTLLVACVSSSPPKPTEEEIASADYGEQPVDLDKMITDKINSLNQGKYQWNIINISEPKKCYKPMAFTPESGGEKTYINEFGWCVSSYSCEAADPSLLAMSNEFLIKNNKFLSVSKSAGVDARCNGEFKK